MKTSDSVIVAGSEPRDRNRPRQTYAGPNGQVKPIGIPVSEIPAGNRAFAAGCILLSDNSWGSHPIDG